MKNLFLSNYSISFYIIVFLLAFSLILLGFLIYGAVYSKTDGANGASLYFSESFLQKSLIYNRTVLYASIAERVFSWILMAALLFILIRLPFARERIPVIKAALVFASFNLAIRLFLLPFQYLRGYVIEHRFNLSNQNLSSWSADIFKDMLIYLIINTAVLTLLYVLIIYFPKHWWLIASAVFIVFIILANFIFPILIDPLFYKFTKLEDKSLKKKISSITQKAGIEVSDILIADASRKTTKINAYFTGIGPSKRIVLYDNLVNNNTEDEILTIVAHEAAHWKHKHILYSILIGSTSVLLLMFLAKIIYLKVQPGSGVLIIIIFFIMFNLVSFAGMPVQNYISRQFEKQADRTAIILTENHEAQISVFKKLAEANISNVDPHPFLKYIIYSHPPILERIKAAIQKPD